jgi:hypothetical protein
VLSRNNLFDFLIIAIILFSSTYLSATLGWGWPSAQGTGELEGTFISLCFCFAMSCAETSSQVKLLITDDAFCIVQRVTAQLKTGIFRDYNLAEAPPGFQAGWLAVCIFLSLSVHFLLFIWRQNVRFGLMQPRHLSP